MQCNHGDCQEAFCRYGCVRENAAMVRNLVYHITHNVNDLEDITQDVFLKAFQSVSSFRGGSFRAYLAKIARNRCYDVMRRRRNRHEASQIEFVDDAWGSEHENPEARVVQQEVMMEVNQYLNQLSDVDKDIMLMRHVYQFSYDEIAEVVKMKPGTIRTRVARARHRLTELLEGSETHEAPRLG